MLLLSTCSPSGSLEFWVLVHAKRRMPMWPTPIKTMGWVTNELLLETVLSLCCQSLILEKINASCVMCWGDDTWKYARSWFLVEFAPCSFSLGWFCSVFFKLSCECDYRLSPVSLTDPGAGLREPHHNSLNLTYVGEKAQSPKVYLKICLM